MTDGLTVVDGHRLEAEIEDGRVSVGALVEDCTLRVRTDPDQLVEGFLVAELQVAGEGIEAHISLDAEAVGAVRDALEEVDHR